MKRLIPILFLLVSGVVQAQKVDLVCEGLIECPAGCWGSVPDLKTELKGLVTIDRPLIDMDFEPIWVPWRIYKETDSRVYFKSLQSGVMMVGSLHRYTGKLIAYNETFFEKDGTNTVYVNMLCKPVKMF